jgi:hypothetical protein
MRRATRPLLGALCAAALALGAAAPAQGAFDDPLFVFMPSGSPGSLEGPCGLAVDVGGNLYVSDYYHRTVNVYSPSPSFVTQVTNVDPLDGPCSLGIGTTFPPSTGTVFGPPTAIPGPSDATGIAVDSATGNFYVNARTHIAAYESSGAPLLDEGQPLEIGLGSLGDGYGLAISRHSQTAGLLYAPDAADNTVKIYNPASPNPSVPIGTIAGPNEGFNSLVDSAVAVDRVTGDVYVVDRVGSRFTERPETVIDVFSSTRLYKGRLKYNVVDGAPVGLAVDNTAGPRQGRVYVTSGNSVQASIYAYPPGAATDASLPASFSLAVRASGSGVGSIASKPAGIDCTAVCDAQFRAGAQIPLTATAERGSTFLGWSGEGCSGTGTCVVEMSDAASVGAEFRTQLEPAVPAGAAAGAPSAAAPSSAPAAVKPVRHRAKNHHHRKHRHRARHRASRGGGSVSNRLANVAVLFALAAALGGGAIARAEIVQKGALRVTVTGELAPRSLPREGVAPISASINWQIATTDQSAPPDLKTLRIEINRNGRFETAGLPVCAYAKIQPATTQRALANCRSTLVGKGSFSASIALEGQEAYAAGGRLLVFNGVSKGKPVLLGHIYSPYPFATSFVIVFEIDELAKGTYGTALTATLPTALRSWGNLTGIDMTLSRRYRYEGVRHSYLSAACPAPKGFSQAVFPMARTSFGFTGGKQLTSTLRRRCATPRLRRTGSAANGNSDFTLGPSVGAPLRDRAVDPHPRLLGLRSHRGRRPRVPGRPSRRGRRRRRLRPGQRRQGGSRWDANSTRPRRPGAAGRTKRNQPRHGAAPLLRRVHPPRRLRAARGRSHRQARNRGDPPPLEGSGGCLRSSCGCRHRGVHPRGEEGISLAHEWPHRAGQGASRRRAGGRCRAWV